MTSADDSQIHDAIAKWLERDVRPKVRELEKKDEYPEAMVEQMKAFGLFGATIPQEYGGLGLPAATYAGIVAQISEVWMSLTGIFNSHLIMAAAVARFGTEAQKREFLPKFASGEVRGGLALTEPDCGTDLQAIRTRAVRDGDGREIGWLRRKLLTLGESFDVFNAQGEQVARVKGDFMGWNFRFLDAQEREIGTITKKWAGLGKELFTSADNYMIALNSQPSPDNARLLLAAGLAIDIVFKEK